VHVDACGLQAADGTVERHVAVFAPDADLDAATARKLAAALLDAAEELDRLAAIERCGACDRDGTRLPLRIVGPSSSIHDRGGVAVPGGSHDAE
jgi:hypothetical protein